MAVVSGSEANHSCRSRQAYCAAGSGSQVTAIQIHAVLTHLCLPSYAFSFLPCFGARAYNWIRLVGRAVDRWIAVLLLCSVFDASLPERPRVAARCWCAARLHAQSRRGSLTSRASVSSKKGTQATHAPSTFSLHLTMTASFRRRKFDVFRIYLAASCRRCCWARCLTLMLLLTLCRPHHDRVCDGGARAMLHRACEAPDVAGCRRNHARRCGCVGCVRILQRRG